MKFRIECDVTVCLSQALRQFTLSQRTLKTEQLYTLRCIFLTQLYTARCNLKVAAALRVRVCSHRNLKRRPQRQASSSAERSMRMSVDLPAPGREL